MFHSRTRLSASLPLISIISRLWKTASAGALCLIFVYLFIFYTAGSYSLSVLYILVYTCQSQSPNSSHHHHPHPATSPLSCPYICSLHLCLCFCPANRFIWTIFLGSTYISALYLNEGRCNLSSSFSMQNIFLTQKGKVKLGDFGSARLLSRYVCPFCGSDSIETSSFRNAL